MKREPPVGPVSRLNRDALVFPCGRCGAPPNVPCKRPPSTKRGRAAMERFPHENPHASRLKAARSHSL